MQWSPEDSYAMRGSRSRGPPLNGPRVFFWTSAKNMTLRITTPRRLFIRALGMSFINRVKRLHSNETWSIYIYIIYIYI